MMGWTADGGAVPEDKCIILGAPHTSAWDFVVSYLFYSSIGHKAHIMIKKEFFRWPIAGFLRRVGCIPVDRSNGATVVRSVVTQAREAKGDFHLCIAPEGSRKPVHRWKMGYHTIARELGCPVYCGYFDWGTKHIGVGEKFELTDDPKADTAAIQAYYESKGYKGKHPQNYCTH